MMSEEFSLHAGHDHQSKPKMNIIESINRFEPRLWLYAQIRSVLTRPYKTITNDS